MAVECAVIAGIFLLMSVIFWRRHRIQWVWATLPLMLVPLSYFVTISVIYPLRVAGVRFERLQEQKDPRQLHHYR